jgi:hypothetical protein
VHAENDDERDEKNNRFRSIPEVPHDHFVRRIHCGNWKRRYDQPANEHEILHEISNENDVTVVNVVTQKMLMSGVQ